MCLQLAQYTQGVTQFQTIALRFRSLQRAEGAFMQGLCTATRENKCYLSSILLLVFGRKSYFGPGSNFKQ